MESGRSSLGYRAIGPYRSAFSAAAAALFPHFCRGCAKEGPMLCQDCRVDAIARVTGVFVCPGCAEPSAFGRRCPAAACGRKSALDGSVAMASYRQPILRTLLHAYKYEGVEEAGDALCGLFGRFLETRRTILESIFSGAAALSVPAHPLKKAVRGFDQCAPFLSRLASQFGMPVVRPIGRRFRLRSQASIEGPDHRRRNASGSVVPLRRLRHDRYVIFDDVVTTGATLDECARALKERGALEVWAVTLLRG